MKIVLQSIPTHIITGFLGAGKTTVLQHLLKQKPEGEVWAVLMNEFGEIGIDQMWVAEQQGIAVKEVLGGCLCCTSQLPMQIALARLLSEFRPSRLFIEPTGLGHPKELVAQLTQPHWQNSLSLCQVITVVDGHRLHEQLWHKHDIFLQQLDIADIVLVSYTNQMNVQDHQQLNILKQSYQDMAKKWYEINDGKIDLFNINLKRQQITIQKQALLTASNKVSTTDDQNRPPKTLPYHYVSTQQSYQVVGWHLPKSWQFDSDKILFLLQKLEHYERIKAKLHTDQGWLDINAIPVNFQIDFAAKAGLDNRLEIISQIERDWLQFEQELITARID